MNAPAPGTGDVQKEESMILQKAMISARTKRAKKYPRHSCPAI